MAHADLSFLLAKLEYMEDFGRFLGIEAELQELQHALRLAVERRSCWLPYFSLFWELSMLNNKTNELLDMIWCWCETHGAASSRSGTRTAGQHFIKAITFTKLRFRRGILWELKKVVDEYKKRKRWAELHNRQADHFNLLEYPNLTDARNLIGRGKDVDNILAVMCSRSRDISNDYHRGVIRRRLFESTSNDDKRKLKDVVTRRWRSLTLADPKEWRLLNIIPIVGTLGIGKTAVARMAFQRAAGWFDERIWVHVSPFFDRTRVLREFAYRNQPQQQEAKDEYHVMDSLMSRMREKRFLLVLDYYWNEDPKEWKELIRQLSDVAKASGKIGNMVIVTTRSRVVAKMNTDCYELQALSADDSWRLLFGSLPPFAEHDHGQDDQQLGNIMNTLLERCSGVPLAIEALTKYIKSRKSREQDLDPNFRFTYTSNPELLESFRLSYELLFPVYWRNFLQFCFLFPEDHIYGAPGGTTFPCLQKLTFSQKLNLKMWLYVNDRRNMFPCLTNLTILNCPQLVALEMKLPSVTELTMWLNNEGLYTSKGGLKGLAATLKKLSISLCEKQLESSECEGFFQDLGALEELEISGCRELTNLPGGVKHLKSIRSLTITCCDKLAALPNWLEDELPSLHSLSVSGCHLLRTIPDGLRQRPGLRIRLEGRSMHGAAEISESSNFGGHKACPDDAGCSENGAAGYPVSETISKLSGITGIVDALLDDAEMRKGGFRTYLPDAFPELEF